MWVIFIILMFVLLYVTFWQASLLLSTIIGAPTVYASEQAIFDCFILAKLQPGQLVVDLGCGNARSLILAAKQFKSRGVGVERSPYAYLVARANVLLSGQSAKVKIYFGDFSKVAPDLKRADVIYLYLLNTVLSRIEKRLFETISSRTRIVSLAFQFAKHQPYELASTTTLGRETTIRLYRLDNM